VRLSDAFRQAQRSGVITDAHRINAYHRAGGMMTELAYER
jgi:hypothetical protein